MISVVVCTYNRSKYLIQCIKSLEDQTADKSEYEVIIINNNSPDDTQEVVNETITDPPFKNFRYVLEERPGLSFARNRGIEESSGEILSFLDDDAFVKKDYIESLSTFFDRRTDADIVGGKIIPLYEKSEPEWMTKYLLPLVAAIDMGNEARTFPKSKFPIGANMAFRRSVFSKYGVFNVNLGRMASELLGGEEKDMILRARKNGCKVYYSPEIAVQHVIPEKRLAKSYIKRLAIGVGQSEKRRLINEKLSVKVRRAVEEIIKIIGTFVLAFIYILKLERHKSCRLIEFRYWVLSGFLSKQ